MCIKSQDCLLVVLLHRENRSGLACELILLTLRIAEVWVGKHAAVGMMPSKAIFKTIILITVEGLHILSFSSMFLKMLVGKVPTICSKKIEQYCDNTDIYVALFKVLEKLERLSCGQ